MAKITTIVGSLVEVRQLLTEKKKNEAITTMFEIVRPQFVELMADHNYVDYYDHFEFWCSLIDFLATSSVMTSSPTSISKCDSVGNSLPISDDNFKRLLVPKKANSLDGFAEERISLIQGTIVVSDSTMNFTRSVVGLQIAKQALTEAVLDPVKFPQWFTNGRKPWRCILLFGPPGTGKSRLAHALAGELQSSIVYRVSSADIISTWMGQSEKLMRELFNDALGRNQPAIIFVDEIDSLCRARNTKEEESTRRLKTEFLLQMERVRADSSKVFLLGATNCPWEIDPAFLRRFQKRIFIGLPDKSSRIEMLKQLLPGVLIDPQAWSVIGDKTAGLSGSDLAELGQEILYRPLRELRQAKFWRQNSDRTYSPLPESYAVAGVCASSTSSQPVAGFRMNFESMSKDIVRPRNIELTDILHSLASVRRTVADEDLLRFQNFTEKFGLSG